MKIQWLKLEVDIFDNAKIKKIRRMNGGNELFVLWIGILTLGMKCKRYGILEISDGMPYTDNDLASEFDMTPEAVKNGLELFKNFNMIQVIEGETIEIINFKNHQSIDRIDQIRELARIRQEKHREKLKNLQLEYNNKDKELDKEEDKIREEDTRKSRVTNKSECTIHGEYNNIKLQEGEYTKLKERYGDKTEAIINHLSAYKVEKAYKTKSDYLTMLRWVAEAVFSKKTVDQPTSYKPSEIKTVCVKCKTKVEHFMNFKTRQYECALCGNVLDGK